jgi:hypothetical protein
MDDLHPLQTTTLGKLGNIVAETKFASRKAK